MRRPVLTWKVSSSSSSEEFHNQNSSWHWLHCSSGIWIVCKDRFQLIREHYNFKSTNIRVKKVTTCLCLPAHPVQPGSHDNNCYQDNQYQPSVFVYRQLPTQQWYLFCGCSWWQRVGSHSWWPCWDSLEVNPSTHQISTYQYPDLKERNTIFSHSIKPPNVHGTCDSIQTRLASCARKQLVVNHIVHILSYFRNVVILCLGYILQFLEIIVHMC